MVNCPYYEEFITRYPNKKTQLGTGHLTFRYAKHATSDVTLILFAGGLGIGDGFYRHFLELAKYYNVITFNYPQDFRTNTDLARCFALLIRKLHLKNVYLVGQSYGGFIAQIIAQRYPKLIKGMILSNTSTLSIHMDAAAHANLDGMLNKAEKYIKLDKFLPLPLLKPLLKIGIIKKCKEMPDEKAKEMRTLLDVFFAQCTNAHLLLMDTLLADLKNHFNLTPNDFITYENECLLLLSDDDHTFVESAKKALIDLIPSPVVNTSLKGGHLAGFVDFDGYINAIITFITERNQASV